MTNHVHLMGLFLKANNLYPGTFVANSIKDRSKKWVSRPGRSQPFAPFTSEEQAQSFANYLQEDVGISARVVWIAGSSNTGGILVQSSFWDLVVPYEHMLKVRLLYRIRPKYHIRDLPGLSVSQKKVIFRDQLHGEAQLKGGWREPMGRLSDLEWYAGISGLPLPETKTIVAEAKAAYYGQRESERLKGYWIAGTMIPLGLLLYFASGDIPGKFFGLFFTIAGVSFVIFAMTRRKRKHRKRLPG